MKSQRCEQACRDLSADLVRARGGVKRRRRKLNPHEWSFWSLHAAPPPVQRFAWMGEIDRQLGSENPAYLSLPVAVRKRHELYLAGSFAMMNRAVVEADLAHVLRTCYECGKSGARYEFEGYFDMGDKSTHLLTFDWEHFSREEIKKSLGDWIDSVREGRLRKPKPGRRESYFHRLIDIAILRLSHTGVTRKEGVAVLQSIMPKSPPKGLPDPDKFTDSHWTHAKQQASGAIRKRRVELKEVALNVGGHWRDYFVKLANNPP